MDNLVNFGISAVATAPSPDTSGTSLVVTAGEGSRFPTGSFDCTYYAPGTNPDPTNAEICRVTISGDTQTLLRAQYGTTAQPIAVGWIVDNAVTANLLGQLVALIPTSAASIGGMLTSTYDPAAIAQQVVGTTATQTLTNKTLTSPVIATVVNTGTLTLPTSTDTLVGRATTDTLTNKTLTSPTLTSPLEGAYITGTAPTATQAVYVTTNGTYILNTASAANNWVFNIASTSGATLNSLLAVGQSVTVTYLVTQGTTAYYCTAIDIDGAAQTVNWQGGTSPSAGNASGIDAYTITIVKTASAAYTVLAALTKF